jgi:hypothetical protein
MGGTPLRGLVLSFALAFHHPTVLAMAVDDFGGDKEGGAPHVAPPPAARN